MLLIISLTFFCFVPVSSFGLKKKSIYFFIFGCAGSSLLLGLPVVVSERLSSSFDAQPSHCRGFSCCEHGL